MGWTSNGGSGSSPTYLEPRIASVETKADQNTTLLSSINTMLGSETLETVAQTIKGAINELKASGLGNGTGGSNIVQRSSSYTADGGETSIPIGIADYSQWKDLLEVYEGNIRLFKGVSWGVSSDQLHIELLDFTAQTGTVYTFLVTKGVLSDNGDTTKIQGKTVPPPSSANDEFVVAWDNDTDSFKYVPLPTTSNVGSGSGIRMSVKDFKCTDNQFVKGDGIHDDTTGIQAAIDALPNGGDIEFPVGTYIISNNIKPKSNQRFIGTNGSIIKLKDGTDATSITTRKNMFHIANVVNVTVENLTFDGNRDNVTETNHCIFIGGTTARNVVVQNCRLLNPEYDAVYVGYGAQQVLIKDNYSFNTGRTHYVITDGTDVEITGNLGIRAQNSYVDLESNLSTELIERVNVHHNIFLADSGCIAMGFGNTGPGTQKNVNVESNIFYLNSRFGSFSGEGVTENMNVRNNIVYGKVLAADYFIRCSKVIRDSSFEGNCLKILGGGGTGGGIEVRNPERVILSGNKIINSLNKGINIFNPDSATTYITVTNNTIINSTTDGISCQIDNYLVTNNTILTSGGYGIVSGKTNGNLVGNIIKGSTNYGIFVSGASDVNVRDNMITGTLDTGIYIHNGCKDIKIEGNRIKTPGQYGIMLRNSKDLHVLNNTVEGATLSGIYGYSDSNNLIVSNNLVKNGKTHAIDISSIGNIIQNNRCYDDQTTQTQTYGLYLRTGGDYYVISGNDFRNNKTGGYTGTTVYYKPNPSAVLATDIANFNFI